MTHKAILDNFSLDWLSRAVEEELGNLIFHAKCNSRLKTPEEELNYILKDFIPLRWINVFESNQLNEQYKYQTYIAIATVLNKYGYKDDAIALKAITGLQMFNDDKFGLLPSHKYKKAEKAIEFLASEVKYHKKKPTYKATITQFRVGDVLSIKLGVVYAAAIVTKIYRVNETPVLKIYKATFANKPTIADLKDVTLAEEQRSASNLNYLPDMANQIELIGTVSTTSESCRTSIGDVFDFIKSVITLNEIAIDSYK